MNKKEQDEGCCSPPFPEDFAERLERPIELAGLSREEFAQRLGIDYDRVARVVRRRGTNRRGGMARRPAGVVDTRRPGDHRSGGGRRGGVAVRCNAGPVPGRR